MKRWFGAFVMAGTLSVAAFGSGKGPEIQVVDNKLSVDVESVPLGRLLRLLDLATGMKSRVPPELANRNISAKFSGLSLRDGVQKVFQGQPLDYVVIGEGIVVTAASQTIAASDSAPANVAPAPIEQTFQDFAPPQPLPPGQQPAMIQTPFGPIVNPRAAQAVPAPNAPLNAPGQQNTLFPSQPTTQPGLQAPVAPPFPGAQPGGSPFASPSSFGAAQPPVQNQNLFGGPQPVFSNPVSAGQQR